MINARIFSRGTIRHMQRIGDHPTHRELRERNEQRLKELRENGRLYETKEKLS